MMELCKDGMQLKQDLVFVLYNQYTPTSSNKVHYTHSLTSPHTPPQLLAHIKPNLHTSQQIFVGPRTLYQE